MIKKKYIISQIYIPFIFSLAKQLDNEIIVVINSFSEKLIALILKQNRKSKTTIIKLKCKNNIPNKKTFNYLEDERGDRIKYLPDREVFDDLNLTKKNSYKF